MVRWQTVLPSGIQYAGTRSWPDTENSCVETNVGTLLGEVQAAPTHDLEGGQGTAW